MALDNQDLSKPWQGTVEETLNKLGTSHDGLSNSEARKRIFKFGANTIIKQTPIPFLQIIFDQFVDLLVLMLVFAALLSFILGDSRNGIIISIIVIINALIGFTQEYKAERILKALTKYLPEMVKVKRSGEEKQIRVDHLVPGDIVFLQEGDKVPADIRIIESYDLKVNEQALTGEANQKYKQNIIHQQNPYLSEVENIVFMGTIITEGEASGVVVNTGLNSEFGKIAERTTSIEKTLSPLQEKTHRMAKRIAILAAVIVIILVFYKYFVDRDLLDALIFSIAVAAALVPEGLPATISVALSLGASKLARHKALVRNLVSVETLGSVTIICTDKTGTLTTGKMTVDEVWYLENSEIKDDTKEKLVMEAMVLCNDAQLKNKDVFGDHTEIALLEYADKLGFSIEKIREQYHKIAEIPFSAKRRFMSVSYRDGNKTFSYLKGAPEVIMGKCQLDNKEKNSIINKFNQMASKGHRVLAIAYNEIFLGLVSIFDPPREEVRDAIEDCQRGQIKVIMITGDNALTAASIAKMTAIYPAEVEPQIVDGNQIDSMSDTKLKYILQGYPLFARTLPEQKYRIVDNLMKIGEIVAVTGDGVNDAPALKRADIGIAMGKIGTDVSREASDIVLLDDNFATIVRAVKEGRAIFDNIKKFLFYIFSSNFGELLTVIIGVIIGLPLPITAVQILAIDLGTDVFPSMSLIFEPPEHDVMLSKPRSKEIELLNGESFVHLTILGLIMGLGAVWNFNYIFKLSGNYWEATAAGLASIVIAQAFNAFLSRCPNHTIFTYPFWRNKYLILAEVFSAVLILAIVYFKPFNNYIQTSSFPWFTWLRIFAVGIILLIIEELYKFIRNRYYQKL